jgi:hypothetical protein
MLAHPYLPMLDNPCKVLVEHNLLAQVARCALLTRL